MKKKLRGLLFGITEMEMKIVPAALAIYDFQRLGCLHLHCTLNILNQHILIL